MPKKNIPDLSLLEKATVEIEGKDGQVQEYALTDIVSASTKATLEEAGIKVGEDGKVKFENLPEKVMSEAAEKKADLDQAAAFITAQAKSTKNEKLTDLEEKALTTANSGAGQNGALVPTELSRQIIEKKQKLSVIRSRAFVFQMAGKLDVPVENLLATAYWVGENEEVTESNITTNKKSLDDHYLAARVVAPFKLIDTSPVNIVNWISSQASRQLAEAEETAFIGGDGSGKPTGIRTEIVTDIPQAGANYAFTDLNELYFGVPARYRRSPDFVFLQSTQGRKLLSNLVDGESRPIFTPGQEVQRPFGKEILESDDIPSNLGAGTDETENYAGDLSYYYIKDGQSLEALVERIDAKLQFAWTFFQAVDGKLVLADAFRKQTGVK